MSTSAANVVNVPKKVVLTYGTYDLFHVGHLRLLERLKALGDELVVGVSTDAFNASKGKRTIVRYEDRAEIIRSIWCVDKVIPEYSWEQKTQDIREHSVSVFGMGDDWKGRFDHLGEMCDVVYLPRTEDISSTEIKRLLCVLDRSHVSELKQALDLISGIVERFE